jgi:hypothetical protein
MLRKILLSIILILLGCTMNSNDISTYIIGDWQSEQRETEWGIMKIQATFYSDHKFKVENFFEGKPDPVVIEGKYRLENSKLYSDSWNKGNPITVHYKNDKLILDIDDDHPIVFNRAR